MATEVRSFQVTIPKSTASTAPYTASMSFPARVVDEIQVKIPPGPSGLMGFRFTMAGNQVVPVNAGAWVIGDDEQISWPLESLPDSGEWQLTGYNTDPEYDHTLYVRFLLSPTGGTAPGMVSAGSEATTALVLSMGAA